MGSQDFLSEIILLNRNNLDDPPVVSTFILRINCTIKCVSAQKLHDISRFSHVFFFVET
ncbi:MAG: hypothetical protein ACOVNU_08975 [Candidatus Kapaibacteriota bacterium]